MPIMGRSPNGAGELTKLESILVVVERGDAAHQALLKGYVLARHFGARLELFHCDSEHALALRRSYDASGSERSRQTCLAEAREFLDALRQSVLAEDVAISMDVACESPLYEGIVHKVLTSCPDLVIKAVGVDNGHRGTFSASDSQLVRTCPVPLMLTRGRPWSVAPRFLAAVDLSTEEFPGAACAIVRAGGYLARGCRGTLDLVYSERRPGDPAASGPSPATLEALARECEVATGEVHVLAGDPETVLLEFAAQRRYDVVLLGALGHQRASAALVGSLTAKLVDGLVCDFILLKPGSYVCPVRPEARPEAAC